MIVKKRNWKGFLSSKEKDWNWKTKNSNKNLGKSREF